MVVVGVQDHCIATLLMPLIVRHLPHRPQNLLWRRSWGHGEDDVVDQLGGLAAEDRPFGLSLMGLYVEVPIVDEPFIEVTAIEAFADIGSHSQLSLAAD